MGIRDNYKMVPEDDAQFVRFWEAYPRRVSKKEARKAWAQLNPSPADVDKMIVTLAWQTEEWAQGDLQYVPHPASWLRAERFHDEPSPRQIRSMSSAAEMVFRTLGKPS